jgi:hypothetical protein
VSDLLAEDHLTPAERIERGREIGASLGPCHSPNTAMARADTDRR